MGIRRATRARHGRPATHRCGALARAGRSPGAPGGRSPRGLALHHDRSSLGHREQPARIVRDAADGAQPEGGHRCPACHAWRRCRCPGRAPCGRQHRFLRHADRSAAPSAAVPQPVRAPQAGHANSDGHGRRGRERAGLHRWAEPDQGPAPLGPAQRRPRQRQLLGAHRLRGRGRRSGRRTRAAPRRRGLDRLGRWRLRPPDRDRPRVQRRQPSTVAHQRDSVGPAVA
ncbi:hypothetical protein GO283_04893 [Ralstonia solanacearum]|nr:hypothetical protein [Ralstonia solanacearum]NJZ80715.1 hypothetical protein [Ralstonia solanacearum]NKA36837.1 hypothetical protein [Ralstonia solanacearum]NKA76122.1 hypothetical protein [Ralstonia solanacearum]NKA91068.1 hypothetical protein [Ralstonia solanacearum]